MSSAFIPLVANLTNSTKATTAIANAAIMSTTLKSTKSIAGKKLLLTPI